jgi:hypothetical protein
MPDPDEAGVRPVGPQGLTAEALDARLARLEGGGFAALGGQTQDCGAFRCPLLRTSCGSFGNLAAKPSGGG